MNQIEENGKQQIEATYPQYLTSHHKDFYIARFFQIAADDKKYYSTPNMKESLQLKEEVQEQILKLHHMHVAPRLLLAHFFEPLFGHLFIPYLGTSNTVPENDSSLNIFPGKLPSSLKKNPLLKQAVQESKFVNEKLHSWKPGVVLELPPPSALDSVSTTKHYNTFSIYESGVSTTAEYRDTIERNNSTPTDTDSFSDVSGENDMLMEGKHTSVPENELKHRVDAYYSSVESCVSEQSNITTESKRERRSTKTKRCKFTLNGIRHVACQGNWNDILSLICSMSGRHSHGCKSTVTNSFSDISDEDTMLEGKNTSVPEDLLKHKIDSSSSSFESYTSEQSDITTESKTKRRSKKKKKCKFTLNGIRCVAYQEKWNNILSLICFMSGRHCHGRCKCGQIHRPHRTSKMHPRCKYGQKRNRSLHVQPAKRMQRIRAQKRIEQERKSSSTSESELSESQSPQSLQKTSNPCATVHDQAGTMGNSVSDTNSEDSEGKLQPLQTKGLLPGAKMYSNHEGKPQALHDGLYVAVQDTKANSQPIPTPVVSRVPLVPAIPCPPNGERDMRSSNPLLKTMNMADLKFLLQRSDASVLIKKCDENGHSPLYSALLQENVEMCKLSDELDGYSKLKDALPTKSFARFQLPPQCLHPEVNKHYSLSLINLEYDEQPPFRLVIIYDWEEECVEVHVQQLIAEDSATQPHEHTAYKRGNTKETKIVPPTPKLKSKPHLGESGPQTVVSHQLKPESTGAVCYDPATQELQTGNQANDVTAVFEAVDNDLKYSILSYPAKNSPFEIYKKHFQVQKVKCCVKHEIQNTVVSGITQSVAPAFRGGTPAAKIPNSENHHTDFNDHFPLRSQTTSDKLQHTAVQPDSPTLPFTPQAKCSQYQQASVASCQLLSHPAHANCSPSSMRSTDSGISLGHCQLPTCREQIKQAAELIHAQAYGRIPEVLALGDLSPDIPPEIQVAYKFGHALAFLKMNKNKKATVLFQECEEIASDTQKFGDVSLCNIYLGDIDLSRQCYLEAAQHYSKAVECYNTETVAQEFKMITPSLSGIYAKLGSAYRNASKVTDAIQGFKNAIATGESKKDKLSAHTSLGNLYQSVGENASALKEYDQSIRLSEELEDYISLGWAHGNMGNAYLGLYQREKALFHLQKSLDLALDHEPTPQAIGRAYNNLGTAHQALNELKKAEENYDLALGQAIYGNDTAGQARVYGNIGNLLMVKKDYERAIPHYSEVLRLSRDKSTVSTAYHNRGCAYYELAESKKMDYLKYETRIPKFYLHLPSMMENENEPPILPSSVKKLYRNSGHDLREVVKFHEETLESIKGSSRGLTLSVSLFESNSRTFHRLQDSLVGVGECLKALIVAEQSRARTLGELMLKRKGWQIEPSLKAPLDLEQVTTIVKSQSQPVVYLSYTGARLLIWVLVPKGDTILTGMIEVPLQDDQFNGKSFDYYVRYSLTEVLVEKSFEMYSSHDYSNPDANEPVKSLYNLIAKPLKELLEKLCNSEGEVLSVILIPDSYTTLLPLTCLLGPDGSFLGDQYTFRIMPSLLTMGIMDQLPPTAVSIPNDSQNTCVVGNPTIPPFLYNGEQWNLGKLPHATKEAEWVAHILKTSPILEEQATKSAVLMRIMNSKVIHIATHGSAAAGFLAFAGLITSRSKEVTDASSVLIYPADIEQQNIAPALVVLSSCDSGRGTVKADGIQGMARAFILAGAQAVLTTLWRVPDESACIFMQFLYQYLVDGLEGSSALQKAVLSLRCFVKYSQYIHWSGYQLSGREIKFEVSKFDVTKLLDIRLGSSSVFPRLEVVKQLKHAFISDPHVPTDVQILRGSPGMNPSEPLIDFIHSFSSHFSGGILWFNGRTPELIAAGVAYIEEVTGERFCKIQVTESQPLLVVFDHIEHLPNHEDTIKLLKNSNTHIVIISKYHVPPNSLQKEIDRHLLRGCNVIDIKPLSMIHTTQRIVHSILSKAHFAPTNEDQGILEKLAEFTLGSPAVVAVTSALSVVHLNTVPKDSEDDNSLRCFAKKLSLHDMGPDTKPISIIARGGSLEMVPRREISREVCKTIRTVNSEEAWNTNAHFDAWQSITQLVSQCMLSSEEQLLLQCLSIFSCSPIPMVVVVEISTIVAKAARKPHLANSLHRTLFSYHLLKRYPLPVVLHSSLKSVKASKTHTEPEFVYVPQIIAGAVWKDMMTSIDTAMTLGTAHRAFSNLSKNTATGVGLKFLSGICTLLKEMFELKYELMSKEGYQEMLKIHLELLANSRRMCKCPVLGQHCRVFSSELDEQINKEAMSTFNNPITTVRDEKDIDPACVAQTRNCTRCGLPMII